MRPPSPTGSGPPVPDADGWLARGNAELQGGAYEAAMVSYAQALRLHPDFPSALNNFGHCLRVLRRAPEALAFFERALELRPGYGMALNNRGLALLDLQCLPDALRSFDQALAVQPNAVEASSNRGTVLIAMRRFKEAAETFAHLVDRAPGFGGALGSLLYARRNCCDWSDHDDLVHRVSAAVKRGEFADLPMSFAGVCDDPATQLHCARTFTTMRYPSQPAAAPSGLAHSFGREPQDRVRVAYLSADFGEHAVSYLMAGVIEQHDQSRFETIGVAWGRRAEGPMRTRMESAFGSFIDATEISDADIAKRLRDLGVDIAVDLTGHTGGQRTEIFTRRAAPIQVNYLGFPATMGTPDIDYILADEFLIPPEYRDAYSERIVYLPECFQANDDRRSIDSKTPSRVDAGLPEAGFVWCSFHGIYKFNPQVFDIWTRLVCGAPGSVLWLIGGNSIVEDNLRREAEARGIDSQRLVFASHLPYPQHLGRLRLADVCLDTFPFNGGATTSDALWAGVPVVTCAGRSFAARMSGSLLHAVGMPELVTKSLNEYEELASQLARNPSRLAGLRSQLACRWSTSPLFATARFCRHLEAAYTAMREHQIRGLPPAPLKIAPLPEAHGRHAQVLGP